MKIAHIINPVKVKKPSDLSKAQPITFETMRIAKKFAEEKADVSIYSAQFAEDEDFVPLFFIKTKNLQRSVLDLKTFQVKRKLPLLRDILNRLFQISHADYFIYTNADIGLLPNFYLSVHQMILQGYDAFVINRRTIPGSYCRIEDIPLMYAESGEPHIGHDCFVFKRDLYPKFKWGDVCIGIRLAGRVLLWNLVAYSNKFREFKELHLTFHIGNDRSWKDLHYKDYDEHNRIEALKALSSMDRERKFVLLLEKKYPEYLNGIDLKKF